MPQQLLCFLVTTLALTSAPVLRTAAEPAGEPSSREISLELIMSDPDWIGNAPENPYWADDSGSVYFEQKRQGEDHRDLVHLDLDGETSVVEDAERGSVSVGDGAWSRDRARKVYSRAGDLYLKDAATGEVRQLTRTVERETSPFFLVDENRVAFHRGNKVFVRELDSGLEYQPADVRLADDPAEKEEATDYLSLQQPRLITWVREQKEKEVRARQRRRAERRADSTRVPPTWYLGEKVEIRQSHLSPSGDWLLLALAKKNDDPGRGDRMPNYVSSDGYVAVEDVRPKVGTRKSSGESLVLLDLVRHEKHEIDLSTLPGITEDPLAELRLQAKQRREKEAGQAEEQDAEEGQAEEQDAEEQDAEEQDADKAPRAVVFFDGIRFSPDGEQVALMARSLDHKDRWIFLLERPGDESPQPRVAHRLRDEAWINWNYNEYGWLSEGHQLYYLSEESGWSQLYLYSADDASTRRLTDGDFVVREPQVSPDGRFVYYAANPDHPGIYEIFRVEAATGKVEPLTRLGGLNSALLSPDGEHLLITHSTTTRPPELYLREARPSKRARARRLTHTVSEAFTRLPWVEPSIVEVASSHQERPVYSRFYPTSSDATRAQNGKRAAVVFVHGAGYLQNAHHGWSSYFREFMFHTWLTMNGYLVLDMDYRASEGYGRDWRTAIYRHMGSVEIEDMADGVDWLVAHHGADRERVGIYGGSYGGFVTFMSLFKEPELFACGAALRPVTDWAHYNHPYTSNILNPPEVDPEAYERSSPIEFAAGLAKPLLICAGMQDDNVFFQDTVRLAQVLIELGKQDWEVALYPIEPHGFREPSSWLDEYRRIFKLFQTHLRPSPYP